MTEPGRDSSDTVAKVSLPAGASDGDATVLGERREAPSGRTKIGRGSTLGRYVVLDRLGSGGMGVVFAAYDPELDRKVAVKVLQVRSAGSRATAGSVRLLREAQAMAKLAHPNVISIYDVGTLDDDVFLAMEFIAGSTLRDFIARKREAGEFDWQQTLRLFVQAGRGLAAAHAAGIVHRDFKPENVMIDADGRARVLDFGLARPARESTSSGDDGPVVATTSGRFEQRLTATGAVMGTPFYMAPEQHRGDAIDERADQFAFCIAVWEALYGARPFRGTSLPELTRAVLAGELEAPPRGAKVPLRIRRALERGMSTDPDARFASMEELLGELDEDVGARRRLLALGGLVVGVPSALIAAALFASRDEPCAVAGAAIETVWSGFARESLREAFAKHPEAEGETTFERVATEIDAYVKEWSAARTEACEATLVRHEQSQQQLDARYACLDSLSQKLAALLDVLAAADKRLVFHAQSLVQQLPAVSGCDNAAHLRAFVAKPSDPELARTVESILERLVRAETQAMAGLVEGLDRTVDALLAEAEAIGHRPTLARVLVARGRIAHFTGDSDTAMLAFERAALLAEAEGFDVMIADTYVWLATVEGTRRDEFERARAHLQRAEAVLERVGPGAKLRPHFLITKARVASFEGDDVAAVEAYEEYLAEMREDGQGDHAGVIAAEATLGRLLDKLGRSEEAARTVDDAIARGRKMLGPSHPDVGLTLTMRARLKGTDPERALQLLDQALSIYERGYGTTHSNVAAVLNDQANALWALGRFEEALAKLDRGKPILVDVYGEDKLQPGSLISTRARLLIEMGRAGEALADLEHVAGVRRRLLGADHTDYADAVMGIADAHLELGEVDAAAPRYEEALAVFTQRQENGRGAVECLLGLGEVALARSLPEQARERFTRALELGGENEDLVARAKFGLARVEADAAKAVELARAARDVIARDPAAVRRLKAMDAWLAEAR